MYDLASGPLALVPERGNLGSSSSSGGVCIGYDEFCEGGDSFNSWYRASRAAYFG